MLLHESKIPAHLREFFEPASEIGLEQTPEAYVAQLVEVFQEVARVLRPDGTLWVNLGDSYLSAPMAYGYAMPGQVGLGKGLDSASDKYGTYGTQDVVKPGWAGLKNLSSLKPKDLVGIPWRVAFALQADGWYLRSDVIWAKPSCMPEAVRDRPTKAHEYVFLFAHPDSGGRYFYDMDAIRETPVTQDRSQYQRALELVQKSGLRQEHLDAIRSAGNTDVGQSRATQSGTGKNTPEVTRLAEEAKAALGGYYREFLRDGGGRNKRTVWTVNPRPYSGAHFAVWPPELVTPMIRAGSSEKGVCPTCGSPWERVVETEPSQYRVLVSEGVTIRDQIAFAVQEGKDLSCRRRGMGGQTRTSTGQVPHFTGTKVLASTWQPTCTCPPLTPIRATVLDPFSGSATTGMVALREGRDYIGIDLNAEYLKLAEARLLEEPAPAAAQVDGEEEDSLAFLKGILSGQE